MARRRIRHEEEQRALRPRRQLVPFFWTESEVNQRLVDLMQRAFREVHALSKEGDVTLRTAAMIRGIKRVKEAERRRGVFP